MNPEAIVNYFDNFIHNEVAGWRRWLYLFFGNYEIARRILGGRWELWVHDKGEVNAVVTWHWVKEWSNKYTSGEHIVAKRVYRNGRSLNHLTVFLEEMS